MHIFFAFQRILFKQWHGVTEKLAFSFESYRVRMEHVHSSQPSSSSSNFIFASLALGVSRSAQMLWWWETKAVKMWTTPQNNLKVFKKKYVRVYLLHYNCNIKYVFFFITEKGTCNEILWLYNLRQHSSLVRVEHQHSHKAGAQG